MTTVVFLGPSLPASEAAEILPSAQVRGPARQGDIASAAMSPGVRIIAVIDGAFGTTYSVWHKEILFALDRGIDVYGAASIGALRAAECEAFGMHGVGQIFEWFRDGVLDRDDEVAVTHARAEHGYRITSEPLVNIRHRLAAARRHAVMTQADAAHLLECAKAMHFSERLWPRLLDECHVDVATRRALAPYLEDPGLDLKAADARELLIRLSDADTTSGRPDWTLATSHYLQALLERDRNVTVAEQDVALETIARMALANDPLGPAVSRRAVGRAIALRLAASLGVEPQCEDLRWARAQMMARLGLADDSDITAYCERNAMSVDDFGRLVTEDATELATHRWLTLSRYKRGLTQLVLDEYRRTGAFEHWAHQAALGQQVPGAGDDGLPRPLPLRDDPVTALREHRRETGWDAGVPLPRWLADHGFSGLADLAEEFERGRQVRHITALAESLAASPRDP